MVQRLTVPLLLLLMAPPLYAAATPPAGGERKAPPTRYRSAENLERITRRVSFDMYWEAELHAGRFALYAGPGAAIRTDKLERISVMANAFQQATSIRTLVRPVLSLGLLDRFVDINVNAF